MASFTLAPFTPNRVQYLLPFHVLYAVQRGKQFRVPLTLGLFERVKHGGRG
jgi:hypothetical protein